YKHCNLDEDYTTDRKKAELLTITKQLKEEGTPYEKFILKRKLSESRSLLEDTVLAAEQIEATLLKYGHAPVLFLGRTPCFIQVSYEELYKQNQPVPSLTDHIFHLNFSGTPDTTSLREADTYQDQEYNILRNMLTPEKLAFYENYMTKKGLNNIGEKLYLVDMLCSGGSFNSFLRILRHYYENTLNRNMPDVHFICLSFSYASDIEASSGTCTFKHETGFLDFKSLPEKGIRPLRIRTTPLQISTITLMHFLDGDWFQYFITHGIEFPAQRWIKDFDKKLESGGKWHKEMYSWFRPEVQKILKIHHALGMERK
ncbi:MAG: hypothetical protein JNJ47_06395, partial [Alphaproteobacteria bacterium]|nr:hypothetical protein [Alphaproteobacteria bacterium]